MRKQIRKSGFTLVEVLIASAIFAIVLTGSILMSNKSRVLAQQNLVKELVICAAQSRLNQVLAMPYEEPGLDITNIATYANDHNPALSAGYSACSNLQIRDDAAPATITPDIGLSTEKVGARHIYSNNANRFNQNSGPFPLWDFNNNTWYAGVGPMDANHYLGREVDDCRYDSTVNAFILYDDEISRMTIDNVTNDITDASFPFGDAKKHNNLYAYALCDDVDDFDGMSYVIYNVFQNVDLLVEVAVRPHYRYNIVNLASGNLDNLVADDSSDASTYGYTPQSYSYGGAPTYIRSWTDVSAYGDMGEISAATITSTDGEVGRGSSEAALDYYRDCIYKEIVVTITWQFGQNGVFQTFSMYGVKSVPQDASHQVILEKTMDFDAAIADQF